jgi:hypothetical protein
MGMGGHRHNPAVLPLPPPPEKPGTHCIGGWGGGPRTRLEAYGKFRPQQDTIPGPSSP